MMIWGQSLQALAFRLASASQAGSVDTPGESLDGKRFDKSLTAGGDGVESAISTRDSKRGEGWIPETFPQQTDGSGFSSNKMFQTDSSLPLVNCRESNQDQLNVKEKH